VGEGGGGGGGMGGWCDYHHDKTDRRVGLIREGHCEDGMFNTYLMTCGWGLICRNGACVEGGESSSICIDSDGGKNVGVRGEIVGYGGTGLDDCWVSFNVDPSVDGAYTDKCSGEECYVYEYFCDGDRKEEEIISCASCSEGVCS